MKSTLLYLYRQTASAKNKADIRTLLNAFDEVPTSENYAEDFAKLSTDRNMADYSTALLWSKVFLMGKSFTSFSGSEVAFALLFPMETLFESYIADQMRRMLDAGAMKLSAQDRTYHLFDYPARRFLMKPDIVVTRKADRAVFICDTKWKVLDDARFNYGIAQPDNGACFISFPRNQVKNSRNCETLNSGYFLFSCVYQLFQASFPIRKKPDLPKMN